MPVKTTRKSPAAKTTTRRAAAKPEAVEGLVLSLEKMPAAKGGIKYSDAADHEEKLNITSMYLSQEAVAAHFGGEIPETITVS